MKRYLGLVVGVVAVLFLIQRTYSSGKEKALAAEREVSAARLQRDTLERMGWLRVNPDEQAYREEVRAFLKWYFGEVEAHRKRFGGNKDHDEYLEELEARAAKSKDEQAALKKAYFASVKGVFDQMRAGTYRPLWTATDKGMRLDVLPGDVEVVAGKPRVALPLVLWGAQRQEQEDARGLRRMVASATFDALVRLLDARGKQIGEMPISGGPDMRVEHPERYVRFFPPQVVLGRYELPLVPADVARMEVTISVSSTPAYGKPARATYTWKLDVPSEWKLRPGEAWDGAEEVERAEEELRASEATP